MQYKQILKKSTLDLDTPRLRHGESLIEAISLRSYEDLGESYASGSLQKRSSDIWGRRWGNMFFLIFF